MFRFQRQAQALFGVVGSVHGGMEPPGAIIPPEVVVGVGGVRAQGEHAAFGQRRKRGGCRFVHLGVSLNAPREICFPVDPIDQRIDAGKTRSPAPSHRGFSSSVGSPAFYGRTFLMLGLLIQRGGPALNDVVRHSPPRRTD